MAHELSRRANGSAAMAFVGETPWHGLGQELTKGASIGVWKKEAGLDWEAWEGKPYMHAGIVGKRDQYQAIEFPEHKALIRSDTLEPLAIVGAGYKVVQPGEVLEFFRTLVEAGGWYIHTAGVLRGGRKVWAMATNDQRATVGKGDPVHNNLLLATSMDGSMKTMAVETAVRVVCANTLAMAIDASSTHKVVTVSHRSHFDHDDALAELGISTGDRFETFMAQAKEMADTPIKLDEARHVLAKVFRLPEPSAKTAWLTSSALANPVQQAESNRGIESILHLFAGNGMGASLKTAKETRWGLLNAITEHVDHGMGRAADTRLDSAWFGRGNTIKTDALRLLAAV